MATEAEIDQVVATWPLAWKLGFKSSAPVTAGTSGKDATPKDTIPPKPTKESEVCATKKSTTQETPKDASMGAEEEPLQDQGIKGLGGEGVVSHMVPNTPMSLPKGQGRSTRH